MRRSTLSHVVMIAACGVAAATALAQQKTTVGEILKRPVEIRVGEKVPADAERARRNYEAFLALSNGDDALRADAMRRLGDLKLEAGEEERIGRDLAAGAPLATRDAIDLYTRLLEAVPGYPRADAVLYQLARAYEAAGDADGSLKTLEALVSRFPRSTLAAEAWFRRGELFFAGRRWSEAESAYQSLIDGSGQSEFFEQATYKLGWARFKSGDNEGALDAFTRLLDRQVVGPGGEELDLDTFSRPRRELVEDTLRVSAVIFSAEDGATGVEKFLQKSGRKAYADLLYATLGDLYASKERWTDAATAYSAFAKHEPQSERAPLLQSVAIDVYRRGGFAQLVLSAKQDYVERYGLGADFWNQRKPESLPLVVREVKQNLQDLAAYYHEQAQTTKAPSDYQEAARWYRAFIQQFPRDAGTAEAAYLLSDALFESHRYGDAASEYLKVAYDYPASPRSATAAYAAVVALEKEEADADSSNRADLHRQALAAARRFGGMFPQHPESGPVLVRTARQLLADKNFGEALEVAKAALARGEALGADLRRDAFVVSATAEFETGAFDRSERASLEALRLMPSGDAARNAVEERMAAAIYRQAEAQRSAGRPLEAAEAFQRVGQLVPKASIREAAEYDAAAAFLSAERWPDAIEVLERFRRDFPKSARQPEVTRRLAVAYLSSQQPQVAAREFERIADQPAADPATQREALAQAAELYEKAGDRAHATVVLEGYLRRYPEPWAVAIEFRQKLADFALATRDQSRRASFLKEVIKADAAAGSARTDRSRYLAARAVLELAASDRDAFAAIRLTLPLKRSLDAKRAALKKALQGYEGADQYAVAEVSTSATFEMAELYRQLATDLMKSERPKSLSGDALEQYGLLLEEQAFPFEEKAIGLHESNAARVVDGLYDASVRRSFDALATLKPARYSKLETPEEFSIDLLAPAGTGSLNYNVRFQEAVAVAATEPVRAEQEFRRLVDELPKSIGPLMNLGILAARQGRFDEADALLKQAATLGPKEAAIHAQRGIVLRQLGRFADAEEAYRAALALEPDSVKAHRNLGILLDLYRGRAADAVSEWRRAVELEGGDKQLEGWIAEVSHRTPAAGSPDAGGLK